MKKSNGFTLFEVLIGISILGIVTAMALPNLTEFLIKMRVDNEISQIQRLLSITRNSAINAESNVTLCPLYEDSCTTDWKKELTVFIDIDGDGNYEVTDNDDILRVKAAVDNNDKLQFARNRVTYEPDGTLNDVLNGTFAYCPEHYESFSRGVTVSPASGRVYVSIDTNNDGKEENRQGTVISCQ